MERTNTVLVKKHAHKCFEISGSQGGEYVAFWNTAPMITALMMEKYAPLKC
jgi:hypothetical protein